ncbi:hypothetical protein D9N18_06080 [Lactococcus raffinolactis]|uniref:Uncharacterized protein n=1 Tax=Pseudolactococcus chungangensis TaxID=451457 RepID=A0A847J3Y8_9LACT|nr:hypothetical protein [Lactococcus raffinolactis]MBW9330924.1 hypothetical protein [Lactococcus raffinolactis]NLH35241.1 hypothetical protein [Lactococcus chungangensis]
MTYDLAWKVVLREARSFLIRYLKINLENEDYETRVREELEIVEFDNDTIFLEDDYGRIIEHNYHAEDWQVDRM